MIAGDAAHPLPLDAVPLAEASDERRFGGKAVQLAAAVRAGLPVPAGWALSVEAVERIATGAPGARSAAEELFAAMRGVPCAARSSAVGEDGRTASFAGQHATVLNVRRAADLPRAIDAVFRSARSEGALAYRRRLNAGGEPRVAVVLQRLVDAECAGVLFTHDPVTGEEVCVIEAAWGLAEVVVTGLVTPDRYRIDGRGRVIARIAGNKDVAIEPDPDRAGVRNAAVHPDRARALCLDDARLAELRELASRCDAVFTPGGHDIEWAFSTSRELFLLQRRPITTGLRSR